MSTKKRLFGTDGIRGKANEVLTAELAMRVGQAAGIVLRKKDSRHQPHVIIGKDTRRSGYMLENAIAAGLNSVGMDVLFTGPLPTPAIAMLTRTMRCDLGIMISASHNAFEDNGIKFFGSDGYKLLDAIENEIEAIVNGEVEIHLACSRTIGRAKRIEDAGGRYIEFVKQTLPRELTFEGIKVVLDCAHGAAHRVAKRILEELGANVVPMGVEPNGYNINDKVGSTHPKAAAARVLTEDADIGIALDGDADRVIIIDERGQIVDGDQLLALIADTLHSENKLSSCVVGTVMSNLGLEKYFAQKGIALVRAKVGDRYVLEEMRERRANLGGEQSGHIVLSDYSTTGDALIAALQVLASLKRTQKRASEVCHRFIPYPQKLVNIRLNGKDVLADTVVQNTIAEIQKHYGDSLRLSVRKSGTEPVIRIMAQGENQAHVDAVIQDVRDAITAAGH